MSSGVVAEPFGRPAEALEMAHAACGSPIEVLFLDALVEWGYARRITVLAGRGGIPATHILPLTDRFSGPWMQVYVQAPMPPYRLDFLLHLYGASGGPLARPLVVECDGHDFHERTKEQAAHDRSRDRAVQCQGYDVFRFTGSELTRGPFTCASQCGEFLLAGVSA